MAIDGISGTQSSASSSHSVSGQQNEMFMKLLLAQLKSQDPMSPMDANAFVAQMVQFNTLDQITQLRQMLDSFFNQSGTEVRS